MNRAMTAIAFVLLYASGIALGIALCLLPASCSPDTLPAGEVHLMRL